MTKLEARAAVVKEAREWIGTPYLEAGRIKGVGCDCASFIAEVLTLAGVIPREELGFYGRGFNEDENANYMFRLIRHAKKQLEMISRYVGPSDFCPQPGDIVTVKVNNGILNHAGIVTKWPYLVHAMAPKVEEVNAANDCCGTWAGEEICVFDPFVGKFE